MIAIIEGCDLTGKTTLTNAMKSYGFESLHFSQPKQEPIVEYLLPLTQDDWLAIDRFHLGEMVYGPLYRGKSSLSVPARKYVDLYLDSRAAVLVLKSASLETVQKRYAARGEDYLQHGDIQRVLDSFDEEFGASIMLHKLLNPQPKQLATRCSQRMSVWKPLKPFPQYIGRRFPKLLLVGDEPGPRQLPDLSHVPFAPVSGSCGVWLWDSLSAFMPWLGVVNSKDTDLRTLWETLGQPRVVALGRNAAERLLQSEVPHGQVPHPQYARRFHHARSAEYRTMVKRASRWQQSLTFEEAS